MQRYISRLLCRDPTARPSDAVLARIEAKSTSDLQRFQRRGWLSPGRNIRLSDTKQPSAAPLPEPLRELFRNARTPVPGSPGDTAPFDADAWWSAVSATAHEHEPRFTPFGSVMPTSRLCSLLLDAPETVDFPPVHLEHPVTEDILPGAHTTVVPTPKGWRFTAGQLRRAEPLWKSVEDKHGPVRPSRVITEGWEPDWTGDIAPTYFLPIAQDTQSDAWEREVRTLHAMQAISPYTRARLAAEGPPRVINPTFLTKDDRPIDDMRFPNLAMEPPYFRPDSIKALIAMLSPGVKVFTQDIKAGWMHVPYTAFAGSVTAFVHDGVIWSFRTLAFGDASAPYVFTRLTGPLRRYLSSHGVSFWLYIDDSASPAICFKKPDASPEDVCLFVREAFAKFDWVLGAPKCHAPATLFLSVGYSFDTARGTMAVSPARLSKMHRFADAMADWVTATDIARAMGYIASTTAVGLAPMYWAGHYMPKIAGVPSWTSPVWWSKDDGAWFREWLRQLASRPKPMFSTPSPDYTLVSDASEYGSGAVLWKGVPPWWNPRASGTVIREFQRNWAPVELDLIVEYETETWAWAFDLAKEELQPGSSILGLLDSQPALGAIRKGYSPIPTLNKSTRAIWDQFYQVGYSALHFDWVPTLQNEHADRLSRMPVDRTGSWMLRKAYFDRILEWARDSHLPTPSVDCFATAPDALLPVYMSRFRDSRASRGNFFGTPLRSEEVHWCNPPFRRLLETLCRLAQQCVRAYVLVPHKPQSDWWSWKSRVVARTTVDPIPGVDMFEPWYRTDGYQSQPAWAVHVWYFDFRQ